MVHFTKAARRSSENISVARKALNTKREIVRQNQSMGLVDLYSLGGNEEWLQKNAPCLKVRF